MGSGNNPIGKITVLVEHMENRNSDSPDNFVIRSELDKDGNFSVSLPPSEKQYEIFITDDKGHIYCGFAHVDPNKDNNLETINFDRNCKLSGIVKDKNGKIPKDAKVLAQMKTRDKCSHYVNVAETQLKNDGTFEFSDLSSGKYTFQIFPAELAFEEIETEVNEDFNYLEVVLRGGAKISGKILDENGKAIVGAKILSDKKHINAVSDSEGEFSLSGIKPGECSLKVTAKGYAVPGYVPVKVDCREAKAYQKDISLARTGSLLVEMEPQEKEIKIPLKISLALNLCSENHMEWGSADLHADVKDGKAIFEDVAPGKYSVRFSSEDTAQLQGEVAIEGGKESTLKFILPRTYDLSGKVVDEGGSPLKDVNLNLEFAEEKIPGAGRISYSPGYAQTQDDGSFIVKRLKAGKYKVRAEKEDLAKSAQIVNVGAESKEPLAITLKKGLSLSGAILEADGKPAANVELTLTTDYESRKENDFTDYTSKNLKLSADGKFRAEGLHPGKYNISVRDTSLSYEVASVLKIDAGSDATIVTLGKTHPVSGKVVDVSGKPVSDAEITVSARNDGSGISYGGYYRNDSAKNKTGVNGDFKLNLREGLKYSLRFLLPGYLEKSVDFDPASGSDNLNVVLEKGCSVSGKVVRGKDNSPVEGVIVREGSNIGYYRPSESEDEETAAKRKTDREGRFSLKTVPAGAVSISVYS
ncbi:MAG: carboxypeptidase-like regulatory domain-containing protein, partial [Victivallales bacterium]